MPPFKFSFVLCQQHFKVELQKLTGFELQLLEQREIEKFVSEPGTGPVQVPLLSHCTGNRTFGIRLAS